MESLLSEFYDWLLCEQGVMKHSIAVYRPVLRDLIMVCDGTITNEGVREFFRQGLQKHKPATLKFRKAVIHRLLHWLTEIRGLSEYEGVRRMVERLKLPRATSDRKALSEKAVRQWIRQPNIHTWKGLQDRVVLELLYCGLRIGEVVGLDKPDLDLEEGYAHIRHGKGDKERWVRLPQGALPVMGQYIANLLRAYPRQECLLPGTHGGRIGEVTLRRRLQSHAVAAGIGKQIPHILRHSCATHLSERGAPPLGIQKLLGHDDFNTTRRYLHLSRKLADTAIDDFHPRNEQQERLLEFMPTEGLEKVQNTY